MRKIGSIRFVSKLVHPDSPSLSLSLPLSPSLSLSLPLSHSRLSLSLSLSLALLARSLVHQIECAIVRILKSRKKISHADLISECISQLQKLFTPDVRLIKRCVENLIEREYLARDDSDSSVYTYIA